MESRVLLSAVFVLGCFIAESYAFVVSECGAGNGWLAMVAEEADVSEKQANTIIIDLDAGEVVLGKQLFFKPTLSANKQVSCASCHSPQQAFTSGPAIVA